MSMHVPGHSAVLVVDDDEAIRESFCEVLADEGFSTAAAGNGRDALDYLESHPLPCLIVLDLMMPVMSGTEFRQHQLAEPRFAAIPVIVMSASDRGGQIAAELGVEAFLPKPARVDQLLATVARYC